MQQSKYIANSFILENNDGSLEITSRYMHYDGRFFNGQFIVKGLAKKTDYLTIRASDFDTHEHSIKLLSIVLNKQEYLYNFNQEQKQIVFSFDTKQFILEQDKPINKVSTTNNFIIPISIVGVLLLLLIVYNIISKSK